MCVAIPAKIVRIRADQPVRGTVEVDGVSREVNLGLIETDSLKPGDWVLVYAGCALWQIDEAEARETLAILRGSRPPPRPRETDMG